MHPDDANDEERIIVPRHAEDDYDNNVNDCNVIREEIDTSSSWLDDMTIM